MTLVLALLAAVVGGAVNSIAGGGTLVTFPALVALGLPPIVANATSAVGLWPGAAGSIWGYRAELVGARRWAIRFALPSLTGGLAGALLLLATSPEHFSAIVPWLVFGATLLFMGREPLLRLMARRRAARGREGSRERPDAHDATTGASLPPPPPAFLIYQFGVAVYGGYFGAGIGILMLAALGFMGLTNIHQMNGLKNWGGLCMNAVAAVTFIVSGIVDWPMALSMAVGSTLGGYGGAWLARRVGQRPVRIAIVAIGLAATVWLLLRGAT